MSLTVLAAAQLLTDDVDAWGMPRLRAMLPVAGMTVLEQQAMRAQALGAVQLLVQVDAMPPALAEALERIRARGLSVEPIRDANAVARLTDMSHDLLIVADGLVADDAAWRAIGGVQGDTLLVASDSMATQSFERLDPQHRWIGLARVSGSAALQLELAPDGWDAQLTLLRHIAAGDAARLMWSDSQFISGAVVMANDAAAIQSAERQLLSARAASESGLGRRWLAGPLLELAGGQLLGRMRSGEAARWATVALGAAAIWLLLMAQPMAAIIVAWLTSWCHAAGDFTARFRPESRTGRWLQGLGGSLQWVAFAVFERGASLWPVRLGAGGIGLTMLLVVAAIMADHRRARCLPDLMAVWPLALLLSMALGHDLAVLILGVIAGLLLLRSALDIAAPANAV